METQRFYNDDPVRWMCSDRPVAYPEAVATMEHNVKAIHGGDMGECLWALTHPPLYTAGTSAREGDLIDPERFDVFKSGRGGQYTYHGPGQRIVYVMLDLRKRGRDVACFVRHLETWIIKTLAEFGIKGEVRSGRVGVWVTRADGGEEKIAAIGVRLKRWVSFHGIAINLNPDLEHFSGIVPCGIADHGVTSLHDLGVDITLAHLDAALMKNFQILFGPLETA